MGPNPSELVKHVCRPKDSAPLWTTRLKRQIALLVARRIVLVALLTMLIPVVLLLLRVALLPNPSKLVRHVCRPNASWWTTRRKRLVARRIVLVPLLLTYAGLTPAILLL